MRYQGRLSFKALDELNLAAAGFAQLATHILWQRPAIEGLCASKAGLPAWYGTGFSVKSVVCTGEPAETGICQHCSSLPQSDLRKKAALIATRLARYPGTEPADVPSLAHGVAIASMPPDEVILQLAARRGQLKSSRKRDAERQQQVQSLQELVKQQRADLEAALAADNSPAFVQALITAHAEGKLQTHKVLMDLLEGIGKAVLHGRRGRRLNGSETLFYTTLLNFGGPLVAKAVSQVMQGPHLRTMQRKRADFFVYGVGLGIQHFGHLKQTLQEYGLASAYVIIAEDASAAQARLEAVMENGNVIVHGLCGPPVQVHSKEDLMAALRPANCIATQLYVHVAMALVDDAPHIPLCAFAVDGSNATLSPQQAFSNRVSIVNGCDAHGINLLGFVSDGDHRMRQITLVHQRIVKEPPTGSLSIPHPSVQLFMPEMLVPQPDGETSFQRLPWVFHTQDYMHIIWRARQGFIAADRTLSLGAFPICADWLRAAGEEAGISMKAALDAHDKQNQAGCLLLFDLKAQRDSVGRMHLKPVDVMRKAQDGLPDRWGLRLFLEFAHRYTCLWYVKQRTPREIAEDAAWCLAFLGYWEQINRDCGFRQADNAGLTAQTRHDMLISLNNLLLAMLVHHHAEQLGHFQLFAPGAISSRFCEYTFQSLRGATANSSSFTTLGGTRLLSHTALQLHLEAESGADNEPLVKFKRGVPRGLQRVHPDTFKARQGSSYYLSSEQLVEILQAQQQEVARLLQTVHHFGGEEVSVWQHLSPAAQQPGFELPLLPAASKEAVLRQHEQEQAEQLDSARDWEDVRSGFEPMPRFDDSLRDQTEPLGEEGGAEGGAEGSEVVWEEDAPLTPAPPPAARATVQGRFNDQIRRQVAEVLEGALSSAEDSESAVSGGNHELFRQVLVALRHANEMISKQSKDRAGGRFHNQQIIDAAFLAPVSAQRLAPGNFVVMYQAALGEQQAGIVLGRITRLLSVPSKASKQAEGPAGTSASGKSSGSKGSKGQDKAKKAKAVKSTADKGSYRPSLAMDDPAGIIQLHRFEAPLPAQPAMLDGRQALRLSAAPKAGAWVEFTCQQCLAVVQMELHEALQLYTMSSKDFQRGQELWAARHPRLPLVLYL